MKSREKKRREEKCRGNLGRVLGCGVSQFWNSADQTFHRLRREATSKAHTPHQAPQKFQPASLKEQDSTNTRERESKRSRVVMYKQHGERGSARWLAVSLPWGPTTFYKSSATTSKQVVQDSHSPIEGEGEREYSTSYVQTVGSD